MSKLDEYFANNKKSDEDLEQYGVKGMKWGVSKALSFVDDAKETAEMVSMLGGGNSEELSEEEKAKRLAEYLAKKQGIDISKLSADALKNFTNFINDSMKAIGEGGKNIGEFLDKVSKELSKGITTTTTTTNHSTVTSLKGFDGKNIDIPGGKTAEEQRWDALKKDLVDQAKSEQDKKDKKDKPKGSSSNSFMVKDIRGYDGKPIKHSDDELAHYGVPGMKWGKRKASSAARAGRKPSEDFLESRNLKKKKVYELSNDELQRLNKRLELEAKWKKANPSKIERGQKIVKNILSVGETVNSVIKFANSDLGRKTIARGQKALQQAQAAAK